MSKEKNVINYYVLCNTLKNVIRTGWKNWNVKRERIESVAEHIYGTQMLAIAMHSEFKYDVDIMKVIYMLAVHELEETLIGDLTQFEISPSEKNKIGHDAITKILKGYVDGKYIKNIILEFDERKTKEAIFAYQCDKLECDIQCKLYDEEHTVDLSNQKENISFDNDRVKRLLNENKSWSEMWMTFGQERYNYDKNFTKVSNYAMKNKISLKNNMLGNNMKNDMTLVIMAAGLGTRFGGLKQIEPIHKNGEFIIDYSIYDAIKCGFNKVVFIIKKENYDIFRETIGSRIEKQIKVEYVFQSNDLLNNNIRSERIKPLGTAHAVLCAKEKINNKFAVINADDFYGYDAFKEVSNYLKNNNNENEFCLIGYNAINTITDNGSVKRGICESKNGYLTNIVESKLEKINNGLLASPLNNSKPFKIENNALVSMNLFGFTPRVFYYLEKGLNEFLEKSDLLKDEYLLPNLLKEKINTNEIKIKVLNTNSIWYGMTYKEDKDNLMKKINELIEKNEYPDNLWDN